MKKTTKNIKPAFTVDLTTAYGIEDTMTEFASAKIDAGIPISWEELDAMFNSCTRNLFKLMFDGKNAVVDNGYTYLPVNMMAVTIEDDEKLTFDAATKKVSIKKPNIFKRAWNKLFRKN